MTCRICGAELTGHAVTLCPDCRPEANRIAAREYYYRAKAAGKAPRPRKPREVYSLNVLPPGRWLKCVYDGEDNDTIPPFRVYERAAVKDFVRYGASPSWFVAAGG